MSRPIFRLAGLALVGAIALASTGCAAEYDRTEITPSGRKSIFPASIGRSGIRVTSGMVATAHIVSYNDDNNIMTMSIRAKDETIVDVSNVISDHDFAFIGLKPGTTDVEVLAGGKVVLIITAVVDPQPATP